MHHSSQGTGRSHIQCSMSSGKETTHHAPCVPPGQHAWRAQHAHPCSPNMHSPPVPRACVTCPPIKLGRSGSALRSAEARGQLGQLGHRACTPPALDRCEGASLSRTWSHGGRCTATARLRLGVDLRLKQHDSMSRKHMLARMCACMRPGRGPSDVKVTSRWPIGRGTRTRSPTLAPTRTWSHTQGPHCFAQGDTPLTHGRPREPGQMQHVHVAYGRRAGRNGAAALNPGNPPPFVLKVLWPLYFMH
jgi:hypothetical protein